MSRFPSRLSRLWAAVTTNKVLLLYLVVVVTVTLALALEAR